MRTPGWAPHAAAAGAIAVAVASGWAIGRGVGESGPPTVVEPAPAGVTAGRVLFMRYCAFCHGPDGRGGGLTAKALTPPPIDLAGLTARRWTDQQLFAKITAGEAGTAMPAWGRVLSDEERWQIVAFVRAEIQKG